ncbi:hypothetical protein FVE85_3005 [Porphyridium purpureum]|uniref:Uncharacterized protein n=1 Tax=Porphyridium purpureum TaxID=35688 RepID=A0A5J4YVM9_PORPP|nr:hypothetical protein FVE85_3005 [Porphyridium purpureum]|eukprot:POR8326..scf227_4
MDCLHFGTVPLRTRCTETCIRSLATVAAIPFLPNLLRRQRASVFLCQCDCEFLHAVCTVFQPDVLGRGRTYMSRSLRPHFN